MAEALIDGDLISYRCAASAEGEELAIALLRVDEMMDQILYNTNATTYQTFLGGKKNFRKVINPTYKANRTKPDPIHREACNQHLRDEWNATSIPCLEADDLLGISQTKDTIICSIDKDLRQIPGWHFNFVKCDMSEVDEYTGWFNFYMQFLVGDTSDNIRGIDGLGPKKSEKILFGMTPEEMFDKVRELYNDDARMLMNGQCLYIWKEPFDLWQPPQLSPTNVQLVKDHLNGVSQASDGSVQK